MVALSPTTAALCQRELMVNMENLEAMKESGSAHLALTAQLAVACSTPQQLTMLEWLD